MHQTRAKTTIVLNTISMFGVVNIKVKRLRALVPSKERNIIGNVQTARNAEGGNVIDDYDLLQMLLIFSINEWFKGSSIATNSTFIHKDVNNWNIEQHGYGCAYLPVYSSKINPIEQFWSTYTGKLKGEEFLQEETLSSRVGNACNRNPFERPSRAL